jgi:hypothetical protein
MQLFKQMLPSAALAAGVAGALLFVLPHWGRIARRSAGAIAVGAGYIAGHVLTAGWAPFPPRSATHWLSWFAVIGVITAVVDAFVRPKGMVRLVIWTIICVIVCRLILQPKFSYAWSALTGWLWVFVIALSVVALTCCVDLVERRPVGPATLFSIMTVLDAGTCLALMLSGSLLLGRLACILAAIAAACFLLTIVRPAPFQSSGAAVPFSLISAGLWVSGLFYSELPVASAVFLGIAPVLALFPRREKSLPRWLGLACRAGFVALAAAVAVLFAFRASPPLEY